MDIGSNEFVLKVVYHGPVFSGRTTNLHYVWVRMFPEKAENFYDAVARSEIVRQEHFAARICEGCFAEIPSRVNADELRGLE